MYEHRKHRLLPWAAFLRRAARHLGWGFTILLSAVGVGTLGYHTVGRLLWVDAFLNASMILSGMGPVDHMDRTPAKLFAALYALFSGLVFVAVIGVIVAPWVHRFFHWLHLEESGQ
jgi:hypothetical protein